MFEIKIIVVNNTLNFNLKYILFILKFKYEIIELVTL